jgi:hypothetical protein
MDNSLDLIARIVSQTVLAKRRLIEGLIETQRDDGTWPVRYIHDKTSHVWTISQVLGALLLERAYPKFYDKAISSIISQKSGNGWVLDRPSEKCTSIYVTSDVVVSLLFAQRFESVKDSVLLLQQAQRNGGWGCIPEEDEQRVRTSVWALLSLLQAQKMPAFRSTVSTDVIQKGLEWLSAARSLDECGWGYRANQPTGNVTATAWSIYALLKGCASGYKVNVDGLKGSIEWLKTQSKNGQWMGVPEEPSEVYVKGKLVGIHFAAGEGTCLVVKSLIAAAMHGILDSNDSAILEGVNFMLDSCKEVKGFEGNWVIPSSLGGEEPAIWDSTSSIATFHLFEKHILANFDKIANSTTLIHAKEMNAIQEKLTIASQQKRVLSEFVDHVLRSSPRRVGDFLSLKNREAIESLFLQKMISRIEFHYPVTVDRIIAVLERIAVEPSSVNDPIDLAVLAKRLFSDKSLLEARLDHLETIGWITKDKHTAHTAKVDVLADMLSDAELVIFSSALSEEERKIDTLLLKLVGFEKDHVGIGRSHEVDELKLAISQKLKHKGYETNIPDSITKKLGFDLLAEKSSGLKGAWKSTFIACEFCDVPVEANTVLEIGDKLRDAKTASYSINTTIVVCRNGFSSEASTTVSKIEKENKVKIKLVNKDDVDKLDFP